VIEDDDLDQRLRRARPVPSAGWRGVVRRELLAGPTPPARPRRLWLLVTTSAGLGSLLLALAASLAG
jgi:hypothetical protein